METYYSKKEYNDMKRSYERKIKSLEKQVEKLTEKVKNKNVAKQSSSNEQIAFGVQINPKPINLYNVESI